MISQGETVDNSGSLLSSVHRTIITIASVLTGLDESILPGLIDGEKRILSYYDDVLATSLPESSEYAALLKQRVNLMGIVEEMQIRKDRAA